MGRVTGVPLDVRTTVLTRARFRCERCGNSLSGSMSIHHRRPRRMGGSRSPDTNQAHNLLALCGSGTTGCHGWIESNRHAAIADGYLLYANDSPAEHPVKLDDGWHWLAPDGTKSRNKPPIG